MILGDNGNIFRIVGTGGDRRRLPHLQLRQLRRDARSSSARRQLLDYTPGGPDYDADGPAGDGDIGAADEIHGESGDDFIYGRPATT